MCVLVAVAGFRPGLLSGKGTAGKITQERDGAQEQRRRGAHQAPTML